MRNFKKKNNKLATQEINWRDTNELIVTTAHDLRNIMSSIYGLNLLVEEKLQNFPDNETQKMVSLITSQCKKGLDLTSELIFTHNASICSLTELLTKQLVIYGFLAEKKNIELKVDIPKNDIYVETRPVSFMRVLDNLFDNALKFTPRHGSIKITLALIDNKAVISISDTGMGIPEVFQPLLFEKHTQTQRSGTESEPSTGLGLYITKQLLEELNGTIWYKSLKNIGTIFYVSLGIREP